MLFDIISQNLQESSNTVKNIMQYRVSVCCNSLFDTEMEEIEYML